MSLDVSLHLATKSVPAGSGIFIREDGSTREITRAEWDEKFPGREPIVAPASESDEIYTANITHNLGKMATEAGIYEALWRPEEIGITHAHQLIELLRTGLDKLMDDPDHFKQFNPENGWGDYDGLVQFTASYLQACERFPSTTVSVSR